MQGRPFFNARVAILPGFAWQELVAVLERAGLLEVQHWLCAL
jgi:hypothetical protein